jgi:CDP-diacylglycerol--serine O-phosphatidyltransferase
LLNIKNNNTPKSVHISKLIPNVLTLVGLVIGVSSIRFAIDSKWAMSAYCIVIAVVIDGLDGRIARMLNASSHFGAELDSLCDFVNFGLCPAIMIYLWSLQQYEYRLTSWASIMLFVVCMAIRLARFNTTLIETESKKVSQYFFTGIPAPSGALLALTPMIIDFEISSHFKNFSVRNHTLLIDIYIVIIAFLLASRLPTISLKHLHIKTKYLSLSLMLAAAIIIFTVLYTWIALPIAAVLYLGSIPICIYFSRRM